MTTLTESTMNLVQQLTTEAAPTTQNNNTTTAPKKSKFKRKPPPLPDDYRKLKAINKNDEKKHSQRWLKAQLMKRGELRPQRRNLAIKNLKYTSHGYYNNLWAEAQVELRSILKEEKKRGSISGTDRKKMFQTLSEVFFKYLTLYKKMDETYDQMAHPQKRILVRKLLDLIITRLLEIRFALVSTECSEYYYFDELSYLEKIPPPDLDVPIPKFYFHDPTDEILQRDNWYLSIKERKEKEEAERLETERQIQAKLLAEERWQQHQNEDIQENYADQAAIIQMQTMERARQGKMRYRLAKYLFEEESRATAKKQRAKKVFMDINKAVVLIQCLVRGFLARQRVKKQREEELELLGLRFSTPDTQTLRGKARLVCEKDEEDLGRARERRRITRRRNQKIYEEAQITIHKQLRLLEAPEMAERFKFQLRTWMLDVKETTGKLPEIPKYEVGGSRFFICPNQLDEEVLEKGKEATDPEYAKKKKAERKKKEKAKAKAKAKANKGKKKKGVTEIVIPKLEPPVFLEDMVKCNIEYNKTWRGRDEKHNPDQRHEEKFIIHEKRRLVGEEVREQVDIAMKAELLVLKQALEKKKGRKGKKKKGGKGKKKGKGKGGKKGKGKKGKGKKKGKKKKKGKDLTPDRTMESLFQELLDQKIITKYPHIRMDSLVGSCSLINGEIRSFFESNTAIDAKKNEERPMPGDANPHPSFGDVKRAVKDICILPMGSQGVHEMSPHFKSVLICGPEGSGKKTLVNAVCTELHATLFDLTAANIAGKYPGKPGLKMLMHLIDKVGSAVAPLVIKIDNCEKTYVKKVPKTDKTEPKRLKKQLGKLLKSFQPGNQMMLIGISSEPWLCSIKPLKKDYQKIIYIPRPDYGTRMEIWRHFLVPKSEYMHSDIHFSLLTKLSDGWTAGIIEKVIKSVIGKHEKMLAKDEKDKMFQSDEPWMMMESGGKKVSSVGKKLIRMDQFIDELSNFDPVFIEQDKAWNSWFNKTPLQKQRLSTQVGGGDKKGKKKGGKGKGKGTKGKRK